MLELAAYLGIGTVVGFLSGLLGIGGGVIIVSSLALMFSARGFPATYVMHMAIATSLGAMLAGSFASLRTHDRHHAVDWRVVKLMAPGLVAGSIGGAAAAIGVPFLTWCNVNTHRAIGTVAALAFPLAVAGSIGYAVAGWSVAGLPRWSVGSVYLPALAEFPPRACCSRRSERASRTGCPRRTCAASSR